MNKQRFTKFKQNNEVYTFDKYIFRIFFLITFLVFGGLMIVDGQQYYFNISCPVNSINGGCENPYFQQSTLKIDYALGFLSKDYNIPSEVYNLKILPAGYSYGIEQPFYYKFFTLGFSLLLILTFLINHFKYNKGFNFHKFMKEKGEGLKK